MVKLMTRTCAVLAMTAACLLAAGRSADAQTLLRWKFKPGETRRYVLTQEMTEKVQMGDKMPMPITMSLHFTYEDLWRVKSVDREGIATIDRSIDRMQMKVEGPRKKDAPRGTLMEFDTASDKEAVGMSKLFAQVAHAMVKKVGVLRINPRGEILDAEPPKGMLEAVTQLLPVSGSLGDFFSSEGMKKMQANIQFPEEPVAPGQTWSYREDFQVPALFGTLGMDQRYEYLGTEQRDGVELKKIGILVSMTSGEGAKAEVKAKDKPAEKKEGEKKPEGKRPAMPFVKFKTCDSSGTIYFDNARGRIVDSAMKLKVQAEISVMGQTGTIEMDGNLRIELKPAEDDKGGKEKPKHHE
jgi:hypothetical protein